MACDSAPDGEVVRLALDVICHDCHWCFCMQGSWYAGSLSHGLVDYWVCHDLRRYDTSRECYTASMISSSMTIPLQTWWYKWLNKVSSVLSWILPLAFLPKQPSHLLFLVLEFFRPLLVNAFCLLVAVPEVREVQLGWLAPNRFRLLQET